MRCSSAVDTLDPRAELVEQIGAHDPDLLGGPGETEDQRGNRQMLEQVPDLLETPRSVLELRREEPADVRVEEREPEIQKDQREQEIGHGETDEADEGGDVVADRVLADRGVDADRQREQPREQ